MASEAKDAKTEATGNAEAAHKEARDYWGDLIKEDRCGTPLFDRLLKGLAEVISKTFESSDSPDLTPSQIAAFYRAVGGDYDVLFIDTPPSSISFIYRSLGAFHSLQPAPDDDGYSSPTIPALKHKGFVTWQTIQLLLGPEEHVPFLQSAVAQFDVVDPETGNVFPKVLPKECFPDRPDDAMEAWYEGVAARLKREAEEDAVEKERGPRVRIEVDEPGPRTSSEMSGEEAADERHGAAKYFADPLYRKARPRPPFVRHSSTKPPKSYAEDRGRLIASVRHMLNPFNRRRSLPPGRHDDDDDDYSDEDATPIAPEPPAPRYAPHKRPHPPRRGSSLSSTDSDSETDRPPSRRRTPVLRHRRSHEPPTSPREYFPAYYEERRYSHDPSPVDGRRQDGPPPLYGPTKSPLFATHVAQLQAHNYYDRRPTMPPRTSYKPHNLRFSSQPVSPREVDPPYVRDRERERERERDGYEREAVSSSRRRRRSDDYPARERLLSDSARTRSHDRVKEEWDERDRSRDRDRERERNRDRDRRTHRYVQGVQDGVSGRRYPVEQPWR